MNIGWIWAQYKFNQTLHFVKENQALAFNLSDIERGKLAKNYNSKQNKGYHSQMRNKKLVVDFYIHNQNFPL